MSRSHWVFWGDQAEIGGPVVEQPRRQQWLLTGALLGSHPEDEDAKPRGGRAQQRADAVDDETDREAALAAPAVGQLAPGIINAPMTSRKMVIATWTPCTEVSGPR
jgi:hypothetical protein